ncbi:protein-disulfide reductase DsbD family protein [Alphaproteobacteria bacterium]|nr:protein-disulfide reductase DsbD family protein [Alphaproteobacteria bacterium]
MIAKSVRLIFLFFVTTAGSIAGLTMALSSANAVDGASDWARTQMADIRLVSAAAGTGDATTVPLGLQFKLAEGWKIYWRTPGDAGFPPDLKIKTASNLGALNWQWPIPKRFSLFGQESYGYSNEVVFPITAQLVAPGKPLKIDAVVHALACSKICVPLDAALSFVLPAGPAGPTVFTQLISRYRSLVPGPLKGTGLTVTAVEPVGAPKPHSIKIKIRSDQPLVALDAFVEGGAGYTFGKPAIEMSSNSQSAALILPASLPEGGSLDALSVTLTIVDGDRFIETKNTVGMATDVAPTAMPGVSLSTWLTMLGLGLLGGFILNFMPCVLPVLSLKLLGVLRHGGGELRQIRWSFVASALGIIACFLLLAGGIIAMKQAGMAVGWGIQFQQPLFLAVMIVLLAGFATNLFGWLEIPLPAFLGRLGALGPVGTAPGQEGGGARDLFGHFLTGAFAALLATPCSAPFLGTALGFALARGPMEIMAIFTALGVGLALPYLLVAVRPSLVRALPRPGCWMDRLRIVLGVALGATAVWLFSVATAQLPTISLAIMAALLIGASGLLAVSRQRRSKLPTAMAAVLAIGVIIVASAVDQRSLISKNTMLKTVALNTTSVRWTQFDHAVLGNLVQDGRVVFVDVTADWCLTCKVNKALVLAQGEVADRLAGDEIIAMRADWTKPNAVIAAYLASFGRYGIPFNAVYGPGAPKGLALPELLTNKTVLSALDEAAKGTTKAKRTVSMIPNEPQTQ